MPCTNAEEADVVFGGEKKLRNVIENSFKVIDGDLYVVITGCTAAITGDDVAAPLLKFVVVTEYLPCVHRLRLSASP